jgi:hypothetical protein
MFIPGYPPSAFPLSRHLPPLAEGVCAAYADQYSARGEVVIDPFGQSPRVAVEALSLGRRVVVATFNPISRLALSLALRPPTVAELRSALTVLADAPMGGRDSDRLENYLRDLYKTSCLDCGTPTIADSYEWDADANAPAEKTYYCQQCGGQKSRPTDEADRSLAVRFTRAGLDYYFVLDRVAAPDDPDRRHVQEALQVYPPRALTAIAACLGMFAMIGVGERSDVVAHLCGLLAGLASGVATGLTVRRPIHGPVQAALGTLAVGIVAAAWWSALAVR